VSVFVVRLCCLIVSLVLLVLSALILLLEIDRFISPGPLSSSDRIAFRVVVWGQCVAFVTKSKPPMIGIARSSRLVGGTRSSPTVAIDSLPSTDRHRIVAIVSARRPELGTKLSRPSI
jgi:hypothetical protein